MAIKISGVNIVDDSQNLRITGVSTFTNGPILVGSATSTGTATQRLQVTGGAYVSGSVGIGTTNPTEKLHVIGDAIITGSVTSTSFIGNAVNGSTLELLRGNMAANDAFRILIGGINDAGYAEIATADNGTEPIYVRQYTGGFSSLINTATLLDASGNTSFPGFMGLGTVNPESWLHLRSAATSAPVNFIFLNNPTSASANAGARIVLSNNGNSISDQRHSYIGALISGANENGNHLVFATNPSGNVPVERMRITSTGNLGIGTTNPTEKLHVVGNILSSGSVTATTFSGSGASLTSLNASNLSSGTVPTDLLSGTYTGVTGIDSPSNLTLECGAANVVKSVSVYNNTTAAAANMFISSLGNLSRSTSSAKYKTDIEDVEMSYSESLIYGSRPVWYRSICREDPKDYSYWGFIAEEVFEIDPRMVFLGDDGSPEGVQYDRYVVHLVNVIQKQQQRLDSLEARIAALEA